MRPVCLPIRRKAKGAHLCAIFTPQQSYVSMDGANGTELAYRQLEGAEDRMPVIMEGVTLYYDPMAPCKYFREKVRLVWLFRRVEKQLWVS